MHMLPDAQPITLKEFENGKAKLATKDGSEFAVPQAVVPTNAKPGDELHLVIHDHSHEAKGMLNDLLKDV